MQNGSVFLLFAMLLFHSCNQSNRQDNLILLKPGYFCKVGAIALAEGNIFIAGSFIIQDNPNTNIPLRHSFLASIDTNGKLNWQLYKEEPDYIHWDKILSTEGRTLYVVGTINSPLSSQSVIVGSATNYNPVLFSQYSIHDSLPNTIVEAHVNPNGLLGFTTLEIKPNKGVSCLRFNDGADICKEGALNCLKLTAEHNYLSAWGTPSQTDWLYMINNIQTTDSLAIPNTLKGLMVNDIVVDAKDNSLLATTVKNGQGPCVYYLDSNRNLSEQLCLDYWPMHGSVLMKSIGHCTLLAFNATDGEKGNILHLTIVDSGSEIVYEHTIKTKQRFILSHIAVEDANIYVAGTLETENEGSSIAIKSIPIPEYAKCKLAQ